MRALVFSLSIGISALGAASGALAQRDGEPVSPSTARAAYSRFAGIYKLITTERRNAAGQLESPDSTAGGAERRGYSPTTLPAT